MSTSPTSPSLAFGHARRETSKAAKITRLPVADVPKVSVVIPALNEAKNLKHVFPCIPAWVHEVILIPGHSTDNTVEVARSLWPSVRVVEQQGRGKGAALRSGFAAATGEIIVMIDADGSMNPGTIPSYIGTLISGADFVKGSRFIQGGGTADMESYRRFGNWALTFLVKLLFGGSFSDLCYGYNAFWTRLLPVLNLDANGFEIETQMNVRALRIGLKVAEIPNFEAPRVHGISNLHTVRDGWRVLKTIFREWILTLNGDQPRTRAQVISGVTCELVETASEAPVTADVDLPTEPLRERAINDR